MQPQNTYINDERLYFVDMPDERDDCMTLNYIFFS